MRLEQLVLFGPSDDFRVHFGPGLTVLAGLVPEERSELLSTLSEAMAGRLPNASLVYADPDGRGCLRIAPAPPSPTRGPLLPP